MVKTDVLLENLSYLISLWHWGVRSEIVVELIKPNPRLISSTLHATTDIDAYERLMMLDSMQ